MSDNCPTKRPIDDEWRGARCRYPPPGGAASGNARRPRLEKRPREIKFFKRPGGLREMGKAPHHAPSARLPRPTPAAALDTRPFYSAATARERLMPRPTKFTPERAAAALRAARADSQEGAAMAAGVGRRTLQDWLR